MNKIGDKTPPCLTPPHSLNASEKNIIPFYTSITFAMPIYYSINKLHRHIFTHQLYVQAIVINFVESFAAHSMGRPLQRVTRGKHRAIVRFYSCCIDWTSVSRYLQASHLPRLL